MYEPQEDSFLLLRNVEGIKGKKVLDMGTGSGIIALSLAKENEVTAVDIDEEALDFVRKKAKEMGLKVKCFKSDLFERVREKFDVICFNPPYLPEDKFDKGRDTTGGMGLIERFLKKAKGHLREGGVIYLIFSSLTGDVPSLAKKMGYEVEILEKEHYFFEDIYLIKLSPLS